MHQIVSNQGKLKVIKCHEVLKLLIWKGRVDLKNGTWKMLGASIDMPSTGGKSLNFLSIDGERAWVWGMHKQDLNARNMIQIL